MEGLIEEGAEILEEEGDATILDLGIIGAGSRVEHYEMAGYRTAIGLAERLNQNQIVKLLTRSLAEEDEADTKLRGIAGGLIKRAPSIRHRFRTVLYCAAWMRAKR
jgi:ferritin-like metal-binding protein YciE